MKNRETALRLRELLDGFNLKAQDLADKAGINKASISQYINGSHKPSNITAMKIANVLKSVNPVWIMGFDVPKYKTDLYRSAPLYEAAAGEGRINGDYPSETYAVRLEADENIVSVTGRSMEPTLQDGDKVIVKTQSIIDYPRQIALVKVNWDESTLRRVETKNDGFLLLADNVHVYSPHFYTTKEVAELPVTISGVVTKLIREI